MDQYAHVKGFIKRRKHDSDYFDYVKTVYVDAKPDLLNFANHHRVIVKVGVAARHPSDNYVKKIGRELAKDKARDVLYRLETLQLVASTDEDPEHFLITLCLNSKQNGPPNSLMFKVIPGKENIFLLSATF